jgi:hypothetical protein
MAFMDGYKLSVISNWLLVVNNEYSIVLG